ncbi:hypothetical protein [Actinoplanes campanulatus]|uniref:hypothetical protein n=1 Tax=Actinoplanes campanulatus TaxID=113559 RepID=UPI0019541E52|nr:hypothetical protein [Actinoplanes capillaceus]
MKAFAGHLASLVIGRRVSKKRQVVTEQLHRHAVGVAATSSSQGSGSQAGDRCAVG